MGLVLGLLELGLRYLAYWEFESHFIHYLIFVWTLAIVCEKVVILSWAQAALTTRGASVVWRGGDVK